MIKSLGVSMNQLNMLKTRVIQKINDNKGTLNKTGYTSFILEVGDLFFDFDTMTKSFQVRECIRNENGKAIGNQKADKFPLLNDTAILNELMTLANAYDKNVSNKEDEKLVKEKSEMIEKYLQLV